MAFNSNAGPHDLNFEFESRAGDHGSTFAGNPLVCATACTVFDIIADPAFLASVSAKGERLRAGERPCRGDVGKRWLPGPEVVRGLRGGRVCVEKGLGWAGSFQGGAGMLAGGAGVGHCAVPGSCQGGRSDG